MADIRRRYKKTIGIGNVVSDLLDIVASRKKSTIFKIELAWHRRLDQRITQNCRPTRFSKGILFVTTMNPVWKNEMLFFRKDIIEKINLELQEEIIKEIIFQ